MNHKHIPIVVFMTLMLTSLLAGRYNYRVARDRITADLNQALVLTIKEKEDLIITRDTIRAYKQLRQSSGGQVLIAQTILPPSQRRATERDLVPYLRYHGQGVSR